MSSSRPNRLIEGSGVARRRKLVLLMPALVLTIATGLALRKLKDLYESSVRMVVTSVKADDASDPLKLLREFHQQLTNRDTLQAVINKYKLQGESLEAVISQMRGRNAVEPDTSQDRAPGAFAISYRASDPDSARKITDEFACQIVAQNSQESSRSASEAETQESVQDCHQDFEQGRYYNVGNVPLARWTLATVTTCGRNLS